MFLLATRNLKSQDVSHTSQMKWRNSHVFIQTLETKNSSKSFEFGDGYLPTKPESPTLNLELPGRVN